MTGADFRQNLGYRVIIIIDAKDDFSDQGVRHHATHQIRVSQQAAPTMRSVKPRSSSEPRGLGGRESRAVRVLMVISIILVIW